MKIYIVARNSHFGLAYTKFYAYTDRELAESLYKQIRFNIIREAEGMSADEALKLTDEEQEEILRRLQDNDPYGDLDLVLHEVEIDEATK